eukprot:TRINITY_DN3543_c2_g1_i1.p1 TRINITY_DN3543_c2_g1~~TRINITY_DN3543_c2_g1_i1.p1  ORF type:complete len:103 (+),score=39.13 TRINITY_DN3543_c2_g1_i1:46-309(+)
MKPKRFGLEAWKFAVYLVMPVGAAWFFSDPDRSNRAVQWYRFVVYPPEAPYDLSKSSPTTSTPTSTSSTTPQVEQKGKSDAENKATR